MPGESRSGFRATVVRRRESGEPRRSHCGATGSGSSVLRVLLSSLPAVSFRRRGKKRATEIWRTMRERKSSSRSTARARGRLKRVGDLRIGISGWNYKPWRGVFYPPKHPQKRELEFASRAFNSIEINGTFYSLQRPESFRKWFEESPA